MGLTRCYKTEVFLHLFLKISHNNKYNKDYNFIEMMKDEMMRHCSRQCKRHPVCYLRLTASL